MGSWKEILQEFSSYNSNVRKSKNKYSIILLLWKTISKNVTIIKSNLFFFHCKYFKFTIIFIIYIFFFHRQFFMNYNCFLCYNCCFDKNDTITCGCKDILLTCLYYLIISTVTMLILPFVLVFEMLRILVWLITCFYFCRRNNLLCKCKNGKATKFYYM